MEKISSIPLTQRRSQPSPRLKCIANNSIMHSLHAKLVCEKVAENWQMHLTQIQGYQVRELLGKEFTMDETLPLDDILSHRIHRSHQEKANDILNQGQQSCYWPSLFSNMLGRSIQIRNPILDEARFVKMSMSLFIETNTQYVFDIIMIDETAKHMIQLNHYNQAHDIRGLMRLGIKSIEDQRLSQEDFVEQARNDIQGLYQHLNQQQEQLLEIMDNAIHLAQTSDISTLNHPRLSSLECLNIDEKISEYLREDFKGFNIHISGRTDLYFEYQAILSLKNVLHAFITLAIQQGVQELNIHHRSEQDVYICDIDSSDKLVIQAEQLQTSLALWHSLDGQFEQYNQEQFIFSKSAMRTHIEDLKYNLSILDNELLQLPHPFIFLLVDDLFLNLKLLFNLMMQHIIAHPSINKDSIQKKSMILSQKQWQEQKILLQSIGSNLLFVFCENAHIAMDVIKKTSIKALITDMEMPGIHNGQDLILWARTFEHKQHRAPMKIMLNTALSYQQYQDKCPRLIKMHVPYFCKGSSRSNLKNFVEEVLSEASLPSICPTLQL